jgi:hypothetical protein
VAKKVVRQFTVDVSEENLRQFCDVVKGQYSAFKRDKVGRGMLPIMRLGIDGGITLGNWRASGSLTMLTIEELRCLKSFPQAHRHDKLESIEEGEMVPIKQREPNKKKVYPVWGDPIQKERMEAKYGPTSGKIEQQQQQETVMVYLVCAVKKATVRQQEDGLGDTLVGEMKAVCATSEAGAIAQYTRSELKDVTDLTGVDVVVKNF